MQSEPRGALDAHSLAGEEGSNEMQKSTGDEDGEEEKEAQVEFAFNFPKPSKRERKPSDEEQVETKQTEECPRGASSGSISHGVPTVSHRRVHRSKRVDSPGLDDVTHAHGARDDGLDERADDGRHERPERSVVHGGCGV